MKTRWVRPSPFWSRFINTASIIWSTQTTTLKCEKQTIFLTNSGWKASIFRAVVSNHQKKKATKSICNDFPVSIYSQTTYSVWSLFSWTRRWWSHRDWRQRQTKNFFNSSEAGLHCSFLLWLHTFYFTTLVHRGNLPYISRVSILLSWKSKEFSRKNSVTGKNTFCLVLVLFDFHSTVLTAQCSGH